MEDTLKNIFYQGLGMVAIAKDKVEKAVAEMVERGKITREEGKKFYEDITSETSRAGSEFKDNMKEHFREFLEKSGIPSRAEFDELKARVAALEKENSTNTPA